MALGIGLSVSPACAAASQRFDLPAGMLGDALVRFGEQAGLTIGVNDPALARQRTRGLRGHFTPEAALRRLLAESGYGFVHVDAQTIRIVRLALPAPRMEAPPQPDVLPDIVVTASKQGSRLASYPGTVDVVTLDAGDAARRAARGTDAALQRLPMVASTSLGPGRNKLFIRGIADSSFTGPTQSTVGQYLGDVRLTYNAPDPDLNLYDIARVEVLEGPQGTLYGTGAIGGIVRLVPNAPDTRDIAASAAGGLAQVAHGGRGGDVEGMANLPIVMDRLAVRGVAYYMLDPGYIDDPGRGLKDINRTVSYGGRLTIRFTPGNDWTVDAGSVLQNIESRDGQYALRGLPPLTRMSTLGQPFDNDYLLGHLTIGKTWGDLSLVSATSYVRHIVDTDFDATGFGGAIGPQLFVEDNRISLFSQETRLSRSGAGGTRWVFGVAGIVARDRITRKLGDPAAPAAIAGVLNDNVEAALFGEYSVPLTRRLTVTLGARLAYAEASGEPLDAPSNARIEQVRRAWRGSPSLGLAWRLSERVSLFARYQDGYRAGGLAVALAGNAETVQRFKPDGITTIEAGVRFGRHEVDRIWGGMTASYAQWNNIQADLVDQQGLPYSANIGDGRIIGLEAELGLMPVPGLVMELAAFLNDSELTDPVDNLVVRDGIALPNIPEFGARGAIRYRTALSETVSLSLDASIRHVGRSHLAVVPPYDLQQGRFWEASAGGRLAFGRFGLSLDVTNLADGRGNRFAYGNPFSAALGDQITPLRPRTIRIGLDARF